MRQETATIVMSEAPASPPKTDKDDTSKKLGHVSTREKRFTELKVRRSCMSGSMHAIVLFQEFYDHVVYYHVAVGNSITGYR